MRFEVLPGLPPYGPPAKSFIRSTSREHREGVVVRFYPEGADPWVGNFVGNATDHYTAVLNHPNKTDVIVVAYGEACIIDPDSQAIRDRIAGDVQNVFSVPTHGLVVFQGLIDFRAVKSDNSEWRSHRISWDGFRNVELRGTELVGEAYTPIEDAWVPFSLDVLTGHCADGVYDHEISRALRIVPPAAD